MSEEKKKPLIIIGGPTASGKSALAVSLARRIGGEVISADSMQIYKGMDIGTAKTTAEEMQGIPHHLIDELEPDEPYNVVLLPPASWKEAAYRSPPGEQDFTSRPFCGISVSPLCRQMKPTGISSGRFRKRQTDRQDFTGFCRSAIPSQPARSMKIM